MARNQRQNRKATSGRTLEQLESRRLMSADSSVVVGDMQFSLSGNSLYRADLDGSNSTQLVHWNYGAPSQLFAAQDKLYFVAPSSTNFNLAGNEPWVSDGTVAGTHLLADLYEGSQSSNPNSFHLVNGHVVFLADRNTHGNTQLFTTDGTQAGTVEISPTHKNGYYGAVSNVDFASDSVSFDYSSSWLNQTDRLSSDGTSNVHDLYSTSRTSTLTLSAASFSGGSANVAVTRDGVDLVVTGLWTTYRYAASSITAIDLSDSLGNDSIAVDSSITLPVTFHDAAGNDTLSGGGGKNTLILPDRSNNLPIPNWKIYDVAVTLSDDGGEFTFSNGDHSELHGIFTNIQTARGNDTIIGTSRDETLSSADGNDSIVGGGGNDLIIGGYDDDTLIGGSGNDTLNGGWGNDSLVGNGGNDQLIEPTLPSGVSVVNGILYLNGTSGDDSISILTSTGTDDLNVGIAGQQIQVRRSTLSGFVMNGGAGDDKFDVQAIDLPGTIHGGAGNDSMTFDNSADDNLRIYGEDGDDSIIAGGRDEYIDGGVGNDTLMGGTGISTLIGGDGNDTLYARKDPSYIDGGAGDDLIYGYVSNDPDGGSPNTILGGAGNDSIDSAVANDTIDAGSGHDTIQYLTSGGQLIRTVTTGDDDSTGGQSGGTTGSGSTSGGSTGSGSASSEPNPTWYTLRNGVLTINGGSGPNHITVNTRTGGKIFASFVNDAAVFAAGRVTSVVINGGAGDDYIDATNLGVPTKIYGGAGADWITGGTKADRIYGGDGNDSIYGAGGNDILYGEAGNDRVFGGAGADHIDGGAGANVLRGEDAKDFLTYRRGDNVAANKGDYLMLAPNLA